MQPDPFQPGSPAHWLRHARSDLAYATAPLPAGGLLEVPCFHAQQAAEKSIKAVLVQYSVDFPRTHSLARLVDLLPADVERIPELAQAARLTLYATVTRYPGEEEAITEEQHREAVNLATAIVAWAGHVIGDEGGALA